MCIWFAIQAWTLVYLLQLIDVICKLLTEPIRVFTPPSLNSRPSVDQTAHGGFDLTPQAWIQMPLQLRIIHSLKDMKQLQHERLEGVAVGSFDSFPVLDTATPHLS